jgi:glutathione S-transferase
MSTSEALPILYSFRRCPYAMRARLALRLAGQVVELREVELKNRPQALYDISPKGTVPVLQFADGTVLEESIDLMKWALGSSGDGGKSDDGPGGGEAAHPLGRRTPEMDALIQRCDQDFKHNLDRYKYATRYEDADPEIHRAAASEFLNELEQRLGQWGIPPTGSEDKSESGPYLYGDQLSFADLAILPFVRQFAFADRKWFDAQPWPQLINWLDNFIHSELFLSIMDKNQPWQPEHQKVLRWPSTAR